MRPTTFPSAHAALLIALALAVSAPSRGLAQQASAPSPPAPLPLGAPHPHVAQPTPHHPKKVRTVHVTPRPKQTRALAAVPPAAPPVLTAPDPGQVGVSDAAVDTKSQTTTAPPPASAPQAAAEAANVPPEVMQFCSNNASAAGQARIAWEAARLKDLELKLRQRVAELEAKRAEYEDWLRKRDEALKKAEEGIVLIYSKMRPEAAAQQLAAMDDDMAAAVLTKLKPSNASAILNEMDPGRAARLTATMVGANSTSDGKKS
jgi:flagellar motility protein MotE (MotC chaperone)